MLEKSPGAGGGTHAKAHKGTDRTRSGSTDHLITRQEDGETYGKLPSEVPAADLLAVGHLPGPMLEVIRAKCLDCSCFQHAEVRKCTAVRCALWPYRMGSNPFRRGHATKTSFKPKTNGKKPGVPGAPLHSAGVAP